MLPDFFALNFILFGAVTVAANFGQSYLREKFRRTAAQDGTTVPRQSGSARSLWRAYIVVFSLVMGMSTIILQALKPFAKFPLKKVPTGFKV